MRPVANKLPRRVLLESGLELEMALALGPVPVLALELVLELAPVQELVPVLEPGLGLHIRQPTDRPVKYRQ